MAMADRHNTYGLVGRIHEAKLTADVVKSTAVNFTVAYDAVTLTS